MSPARFWLGMAEMGMATIAAVLLFTTGVSGPTIAAALLATGFAIVSESASTTTI